MKKVVAAVGFRTHASEETGALNQRLRPLGHATDAQTLEGDQSSSVQYVPTCTHRLTDTRTHTHTHTRCWCSPFAAPIGSVAERSKALV